MAELDHALAYSELDDGTLRVRRTWIPKWTSIDAELDAPCPTVRLSPKATSWLAMLECFVHAELAKATWLCEEPTAISHHRDKDRIEVDLVLTRSSGEVVGVKVKASATARPEDFRGLRRLQEAAGADFRCGIVLHDGDRVEPVAPQLFAMPVAVLWSS